MSEKMESFSEDLNVAMTNVHDALKRWGLAGWQEYLVVRVPGKAESFIVLAHPSDKSDFADQLVALHRTERVLTPETLATLRAAAETVASVADYINDAVNEEGEIAGSATVDPLMFVHGELLAAIGKE